MSRGSAQVRKRSASRLPRTTSTALFSGAVFVEGIFAWPGVGRILIQAVLARDTPVVLAAVTVSAVLVVLGNLLADLLRTWADPRLTDV